MSMEYRRKIGTFMWHVSPDCEKWPTDRYVSTDEDSLRDYLICLECRVRTKQKLTSQKVNE